MVGITLSRERMDIDRCPRPDLLWEFALISVTSAKNCHSCIGANTSAWVNQWVIAVEYGRQQELPKPQVQRCKCSEPLMEVPDAGLKQPWWQPRLGRKGFWNPGKLVVLKGLGLCLSCAHVGCQAPWIWGLFNIRQGWILLEGSTEPGCNTEGLDSSCTSVAHGSLSESSQSSAGAKENTKPLSIHFPVAIWGGWEVISSPLSLKKYVFV